MNSRLYGNLIFELSKEGRKGYSLPKNNFGDYEIPASMQRTEEAQLPECDELTVVRHHIILPLDRSYGDNSIVTLSPGKILI